MPNILFNDSDGVSLSLPDFLFFQNKVKSKNISPFASIDPANVKSPWQSATSPAAQHNKKSIILDCNSFPSADFLNVGEAMAFVARLKNAGFKIYMRVAGKDSFAEVEEDMKNLHDNFSSLKEFDAKNDYRILAEKYQLSRDRGVLLNRKQRMEIESSLLSQSFKDSYFQGNPWQTDFRKFSYEEAKNILRKDNATFSDFIFVISNCELPRYGGEIEYEHDDEGRKVVTRRISEDEKIFDELGLGKFLEYGQKESVKAQLPQLLKLMPHMAEKIFLWFDKIIFELKPDELRSLFEAVPNHRDDLINFYLHHVIETNSYYEDRDLDRLIAVMEAFPDYLEKELNGDLNSPQWKEIFRKIDFDSLIAAWHKNPRDEIKEALIQRIRDGLHYSISNAPLSIAALKEPIDHDLLQELYEIYKDSNDDGPAITYICKFFVEIKRNPEKLKELNEIDYRLFDNVKLMEAFLNHLPKDYAESFVQSFGKYIFESENDSYHLREKIPLLFKKLPEEFLNFLKNNISNIKQINLNDEQSLYAFLYGAISLVELFELAPKQYREQVLALYNKISANSLYRCLAIEPQLAEQLIEKALNSNAKLNLYECIKAAPNSKKFLWDKIKEGRIKLDLSDISDVVFYATSNLQEARVLTAKFLSSDQSSRYRRNDFLEALQVPEFADMVMKILQEQNFNIQHNSDISVFLDAVPDYSEAIVKIFTRNPEKGFKSYKKSFSGEEKIPSPLRNFLRDLYFQEIAHAEELPEDLIKYELTDFPKELGRVLQKPTLLHINKIHADRIAEICAPNAQENLSKVVTLRIVESASKDEMPLEDFQKLLDSLPSLRHLILPKDFPQELFDLVSKKYSHQIFDREEFLIRKRTLQEEKPKQDDIDLAALKLKIAELDLRLMKAKAAEISASESSSIKDLEKENSPTINAENSRSSSLPNIDIRPQIEAENFTEDLSRDIFVAMGGTNKDELIKPSSGEQIFGNAKAGEVLNRLIEKPLIREAVIQRDIMVKTEYDGEYFPAEEKFKKVEVPRLSEEKIAEFKSATDATYYKFNRPLNAGAPYRLLSASFLEEFMGFSVDNDATIEIKKGDDDFYYVTSSKNCQFSYVTKVDDKNNDQELPDGKLKDIVNQYKNSPLFKMTADKDSIKIPEYDPQKHQEWLEEIYAKRSGSCRHRVAAVEYDLRKKGFSKDDIRATVINGNHVVLEVRENNIWHTIDLGGAAVTQQNHKLRSVEYSAPAARKIEKKIEKDEENEEKFFSPQAKNVSSKQEILESENPVSKSSKAEILDEAPATQALSSEVSNLNQSSKIPDSEIPKPIPLSPSIIEPQSSPIVLQAQIPSWVKKPKSEIESDFKALSQLKNVGNIAELNAHIANQKNKKILIATDQISAQANQIIAQAKAAGRRIYYIDSPEKIDIAQTNLFLSESDSILREKGLLEDFLAVEGKSEIEPEPLLLVNWEAFDPAQKVALNTALDRNSKRTIRGVKIPQDVQIISLCSEKSSDASFVTRHDISLSAKISLPKIPEVKVEKSEEIDLQGFPNWRRQLFGPVILVGDVLQWQKSAFVQALENGDDGNFSIKNISAEAIKKLQYEIAQAKALGSLNYHGYEIKLPDNFAINFDNHGFDFSKFSTKISKNITHDLAPKESVLINAYLFDQLLQKNEIKDGKYFQHEGLLENYQDQNLKLFISAPLSESQWYCLFNEAKKKNVQLKLYLAPLVEFPASINVSEIKVSVNGKEEKLEIAQIIVSNNPDKVMQSLGKNNLVIDVEDYSYQDLIEAVKFKLSGNKFDDFSKTPSQFLELLQQQEKVVLKGKFSADLLQMLHPLLLENFPNLTVIIEDEFLSKEATIYPDLAFINSENYKISYQEKSPEIAPKIYKEELDKSPLDENSKTKAKEFIEKRKKVFTQMVKEGIADDVNIFQLFGESGVGKSSLIRAIEEDPKSPFKVYREMDSFDQWKTNDADGKIKILFCDESNIEDTHFTKFSPLKKGGNRHVLHEGKVYNLDKNHIFVPACNSINYGGGRVEQKLFADNSIPQMQLEDFPVSYIYEKILREAIYDKLSKGTKRKIPEKIFKEECKSLIAKYQERNGADKDPAENLTVRELQAQALEFLAKIHDAVRVNPDRVTELKGKNFVSTEATKEAEKTLLTTLSISQKQRIGKFPSHAVGINGALFKGDSGVGKSEMIRAALEQTKTPYYKIDASMTLAQKIKITAAAFEERKYLWIDELNSCIDDGFEKVLNAALTGEHPISKKKLPNPGFGVVAGINEISEEGRSAISPALKHRLHYHEMKSLNEYEQEDFAKIIEHWLENAKTKNGEKVFADKDAQHSVAQEIAADFVNLIKKDPQDKDLNLRSLKKVVLQKRVLKKYRDNLEEREDDSLESSSEESSKSPSNTPTLSKRESFFSRLMQKLSKGSGHD